MQQETALPQSLLVLPGDRCEHGSTCLRNALALRAVVAGCVPVGRAGLNPVQHTTHPTEQDPVLHLSCLQSPPPQAGSQQQDPLEAGLGLLQLQSSGDAGRAASTSRDSSSHAGAKLAAGAAAGSPAAGEEVVSQSRASSQIRVKKFHKLLGEPLVGFVSQCTHYMTAVPMWAPLYL